MFQKFEEGDFIMKKVVFAVVGATALGLAACNPSEDAAGDAVAEEAEAQVEILEEAAEGAEAMGDEATAEALEEQAEQVDEAGEVAEEVAEGDM